jgi:hypothetical protein
MKKEYRFYSKVPKEYKDNLRFRRDLLSRAEGDTEYQQALIQMCREDMLFFFNAFVWLYEPRPRRDSLGNPLPQVIPFISWPHQDIAIKLIDAALGFDDIGAEKSRGEGASWMALMTVLHRWLFFDMIAVGLVSRNELAVDNPEDPDSLMWKLDWELTKLPLWMAGELGVDYTRNLSKHVLKNLRNQSTITGYSAVGDVGTGGRKYVFVMDEMSKFPRPADQEAMDSTGPVTDCRFVISTPKGADGAYYQIMHSDNEMVTVTLRWQDNISRNRGLFRLIKATPAEQENPDIETFGGLKLQAVDSEKYELPSEEFKIKFFAKDLKRLSDRGYAVNDENKEWSPWYVKQCLRAGATPKSVAQEYDLDYGGSVSRFFNAAVIDRLIVETAVDPIYTGDIIVESSDFSSMFMSNPAGYLRIWCPLYNHRYPPKNTDYVVACDVAQGMGGVRSSNSTIVVVDRKSGYKVAEYACPTTPPEKLADIAIAMCLWFGGQTDQAFLIWEDNGYGGTFRNRVLETSFRNFYYRGATDETSRKKTKKPGWNTNKKSKTEMLGQYSYALGEGLYINPSRSALTECKDYQLLPGGRIEHTSAASSEDPSGAGENHGDRVIADALANWVLYEHREGLRTDPEPLGPSESKLPETSILALRRAMEEKAKKRNDW